jgi:hypothetical protein
VFKRVTPAAHATRRRARARVGGTKSESGAAIMAARLARDSDATMTGLRREAVQGRQSAVEESSDPSSTSAFVAFVVDNGPPTNGRIGASHRAHWKSPDHPAEQPPALPIEQQRHSCPLSARAAASPRGARELDYEAEAISMPAMWMRSTPTALVRTSASETVRRLTWPQQFWASSRVGGASFQILPE